MHFFGESTPPASVVRYFADYIRKDSAIHTRIAGLFEATDWRLRLSAAEVFAEAGPEYLEPVLPQLLAMLENHRGLESWSARIPAAEHLLNDRHYSRQAIDIILPALDYGAHPLVRISYSQAVRRQAALALRRRKAEYRQPHVSKRLERLLQEDSDPQALDAAYSALTLIDLSPAIELRIRINEGQQGDACDQNPDLTSESQIVL